MHLCEYIKWSKLNFSNYLTNKSTENLIKREFFSMHVKLRKKVNSVKMKITEFQNLSDIAMRKKACVVT